MDHRHLARDSDGIWPAAHLACHRKRPPEGVKELVISTPENKNWFVYVLRCSNGALYTGVTTDVQRRIREHSQQGRLSARFTRAFAPVDLVYSCCAESKSQAYRIEYRIKRLSRRKKNTLITEKLSGYKLIEYLDIVE